MVASLCTISDARYSLDYFRFFDFPFSFHVWEEVLSKSAKANRKSARPAVPISTAAESFKLAGALWKLVRVVADKWPSDWQVLPLFGVHSKMFVPCTSITYRQQELQMFDTWGQLVKSRPMVIAQARHRCHLRLKELYTLRLYSTSQYGASDKRISTLLHGEHKFIRTSQIFKNSTSWWYRHKKANKDRETFVIGTGRIKQDRWGKHL